MSWYCTCSTLCTKTRLLQIIKVWACSHSGLVCCFNSQHFREVVARLQLRYNVVYMYAYKQELLVLYTLAVTILLKVQEIPGPMNTTSRELDQTFPFIKVCTHETSALSRNTTPQKIILCDLHTIKYSNTCTPYRKIDVQGKFPQTKIFVGNSHCVYLLTENSIYRVKYTCSVSVTC